jgi:peptidoglycan/LPS O-acetylase OafA/YrhL
VIWASQTAHRNADIGINNRWIAFSFTAVFVFGFVAKDFRHHRRRPVFWATFSALLAAHFAILSHVFPAHEQVPFLLAIPLSIAEMFAVYILLGISGFPLKPHDDVAKPPSL